MLILLWGISVFHMKSLVPDGLESRGELDCSVWSTSTVFIFLVNELCYI